MRARKWFAVFATPTVMVFLNGPSLVEARTPTFAESYATLPPIPDGKARIIFFRESHFVGAGAEARVKINGTKITEVENDQAVPVDIDAGLLDIGIDMWSERGRAAIPLQVEAQREYYIELGGGPESPAQYTPGVVPYIFGSLRRILEKPVCGGGWCAQVEDRDTALPHISDTELVPPIVVSTRN